MEDTGGVINDCNLHCQGFFYNTYLADPSRPTEPEAPPPPAREERVREHSVYLIFDI